MTSARNQMANEELRQRVLDTFANLGYESFDAASEQGGNYIPTGRVHDGEVILRARMRAVLPGLNPHIPWKCAPKPLMTRLPRCSTVPRYSVQRRPIAACMVCSKTACR